MTPLTSCQSPSWTDRGRQSADEPALSRLDIRQAHETPSDPGHGQRPSHGARVGTTSFGSRLLQRGVAANLTIAFSPSEQRKRSTIRYQGIGDFGRVRSAQLLKLAMEAVFGAEHHDRVTSKGAREGSALPDGVQRIVGGVEIENDLLGWVAVASIKGSTNNAPIFAPIPGDPVIARRLRPPPGQSPRSTHRLVRSHQFWSPHDDRHL